MIKFWIQSDKIRDRVYIPKFYNPGITERLGALASTHSCVRLGDLVDENAISIASGDEIGKSAYGTGDIPFVRTSDISNWEIKASAKQGVSQEIYDEYRRSQDVREGDILFVRDGTYLIGVNCLVTKLDLPLLYQSHLLKLRVNDISRIDPSMLFLALNCPVVQSQIRSFQFTADIIDTLGRRFLDTVMPIPRDEVGRKSLQKRCNAALRVRMKGKAFIKYFPLLIDDVLRSGDAEAFDRFFGTVDDEVIAAVKHSTITSEFAGFEHFWLDSEDIRDRILIPRYYDPSIAQLLAATEDNCDLHRIGDLRARGTLAYQTGDEIGKMAYGTGTIPFLRTSDFTNWEISHDPKQGVARAVFDQYSEREDVRENDVLLVRDGTYLVGTSCIITKADVECLYCGGLVKIRATQPEEIDPFLLLGLLNSLVVKRQIRSKQFTRDVIDTLGNRLDEVYLPVPKSRKVRQKISASVQGVIKSRVENRAAISRLAAAIEGASRSV